jgi:hypothetical protein
MHQSKLRFCYSLFVAALVLPQVFLNAPKFMLGLILRVKNLGRKHFFAKQEEVPLSGFFLRFLQLVVITRLQDRKLAISKYKGVCFKVQPFILRNSFTVRNQRRKQRSFERRVHFNNHSQSRQDPQTSLVLSFVSKASTMVGYLQV